MSTAFLLIVLAVFACLFVPGVVLLFMRRRGKTDIELGHHKIKTNQVGLAVVALGVVVIIVTAAVDRRDDDDVYRADLDERAADVARLLQGLGGETCRLTHFGHLKQE
jgi:hypothetical protein